MIKSLDLENFVNLIGEIENDGVPIYMTAIDVLVISSVTEAFPMVVLETLYRLELTKKI